VYFCDLSSKKELQLTQETRISIAIKKHTNIQINENKKFLHKIKKKDNKIPQIIT
jgi:DNA-directed RNA polymerase subunit H (RpoH/RPB5)